MDADKHARTHRGTRQPFVFNRHVSERSNRRGPVALHVKHGASSCPLLTSPPLLLSPSPIFSPSLTTLWLSTCFHHCLLSFLLVLFSQRTQLFSLPKTSLNHFPTHLTKKIGGLAGQPSVNPALCTKCLSCLSLTAFLPLTSYIFNFSLWH